MADEREVRRRISRKAKRDRTRTPPPIANKRRRRRCEDSKDGAISSPYPKLDPLSQKIELTCCRFLPLVRSASSSSLPLPELLPLLLSYSPRLRLRSERSMLEAEDLEDEKENEDAEELRRGIQGKGCGESC